MYLQSFSIYITVLEGNNSNKWEKKKRLEYYPMPNSEAADE